MSKLKTVFLTREQAEQLSEDLIEYVRMEDSNKRDIFQGFKLIFDKEFLTDIQPDKCFLMEPIPNSTEIG